MIIVDSDSMRKKLDHLACDCTHYTSFFSCMLEDDARETSGSQGEVVPATIDAPEEQKEDEDENDRLQQHKSDMKSLRFNDSGDHMAIRKPRSSAASTLPRADADSGTICR